jgi:hypothetical protein
MPAKKKNEDRRKMEAIWRTAAWKKRSDELLLAHPRCEWCNGKSQVVNHRRQGLYPGYELALREEVDVICHSCHNTFTKTGKKTHRMYDDCESCEAAIFKGRKICWICGGKAIQFKEVDPEKRADLLKIMGRCSDVRVGDIWAKVWAWGESEIEICGFKKQEDSDLPWPMVETSLGDVGLPAFMFGVIRKQGAGESWMAMFSSALTEGLPKHPFEDRSDDG